MTVNKEGTSFYLTSLQFCPSEVSFKSPKLNQHQATPVPKVLTQIRSMAFSSIQSLFTLWGYVGNIIAVSILYRANCARRWLAHNFFSAFTGLYCRELRNEDGADDF